jgi:hypothetical protein
VLAEVSLERENPDFERVWHYGKCIGGARVPC